MLVSAYSGDAVYLYSTADDPNSEDSMSPSLSPLRASNRNLDESVATKVAPVLHEASGMGANERLAPIMMDQVTSNADDDQGHDSEDSYNDAGGYLEFVDLCEVDDEESFLPHVPVVLPRRRFAGARNVATVKDGEPDHRSLLKVC